MKASEIMEQVFDWAQVDFTGKRTCDTLKAGSPDVEVEKAAVCCFPSLEVLEQAARWGAQLLITHEPLYYNHWDEPKGLPVEEKKRAFIEQSGMTIYRYHDHPHLAPEDMIRAGELRSLGLAGKVEPGEDLGVGHVTLDEPISPRALARRIEEKLRIRHVRICGALDEPCIRVTTAFGAPGSLLEEFAGWPEIMIVGEASEWSTGEYARDAAHLGLKKSLLILGHCGSERDGMRFVADLMRDRLPGIETKFFDTPEVFTYPENV